jgi:3-methyl-2-oxobutanoate hydroxymethyltransferase
MTSTNSTTSPVRKKPTVADLLAGKGKIQRTNVLAWTVDEAAAAEAAGIDIVTTGHNPQLPAIRAAAPTAFMITGMDYGRLATTDDYLREACTLYKIGVDAMYCVASLETIGRLAAEGFPIMSHVGLIPSKATWTGGFRAVGKTAEGAMKIFRQIKRLEDVGALGAEIEVVPAEVASAISARTSLFMMSMGAGAGCDAQYLFAEDILGSHDGHYPRHAKKYRDLRAEYARIQLERIAALTEFRNDVASGRFPEAGNLVPIASDELDKFLHELDAES